MIIETRLSVCTRDKSEDPFKVLTSYNFNMRVISPRTSIVTCAPGHLGACEIGQLEELFVLLLVRASNGHEQDPSHL